MMVETIQRPRLRLPETTESLTREAAGPLGADLRWTQPNALKMRYELQSGDTRVATLCVKGLFRPRAIGESAEGRWTFEPVGSAPGKIVVRADDSYRDVAEFDMSGSDHSGILRLLDGRAFFLKSDSWKGHAEFQTLAGEALLRFRVHGVIRLSAEVEVVRKGAQLAELPWLLMLSWCLIVGYL